MPPLAPGFAELIVSPMRSAPRDRFVELLRRAEIPCVTQLQRGGDCLVRYATEGRPQPSIVAESLKKNIHALVPRAYVAKDQALIADVFVNEKFEIEDEGVGDERKDIGMRHRETEMRLLEMGTRHLAMTGQQQCKDPLIGEQKHLKALNAELAWRGIGQSVPIVAVLDEGVWLKHPDLEDILVPGITIGCDPLTAPCDGRPAALTAQFGHGTKVAGVIGAEACNNNGIAGVARNSKIMPINIGIDGGNDFTAACGVEVAIRRGATVLNASWWHKTELKALRTQLLAADARVVFVGAAGSGGQLISGKHPSYPLIEDLPNVIGVAAHREPDSRVKSSKFSARHVHLAAQADTFTTVICDNCEPKYEKAQGNTSYATAYVSGMVALLKTRFPDWKHDWIKWRLIETAIDSQGLGYVSASGGRLDLGAAMFPVTASAPEIDRAKSNAIGWTRAIRVDMCQTVSISARIGELDNPGNFIVLTNSTPNDGEESFAPDSLPTGAAPLIQFRVACVNGVADAETPPIPLVP